MHTYKGYQIPDRGDKEWADVMHTFMYDLIDLKTSEILSTSGEIYCTNVTPTSTGNIYNKSFIDGLVLNGFTTTTQSITVFVTAISGNSRLKPIATVNSVAITNFSPTSSPDVWTGSIAITLDSSNIITINHVDGAVYTLTATISQAPTITNIVFTGGYPSTQTELKSGDVFGLQITSNTNMSKIEVADYGASTYLMQSISPTTSTIIPITIANRGNTPTQYEAKVRIYDANNTVSDWSYTNTTGSIDGINVVTLNNISPVISITNLTYPNSQSALKSSETATFNLNITNYDSFNKTSSTGELSVASVAIGSTLVSCIGGTYNVSNPNITINATRLANASTSSQSINVKIVTVAPILTVTQPYARLRSGVSTQNYSISFSSNQLLANAPSMSLAAGGGTWNGSFSGSGSSWNRTLSVSDSDSKGTFQYTSVSATGLSGLTVNSISTGSSYVLGGFIRRTLTIAAWPNRSALIGTNVVDTSKLLASNLSTGASGSYNISYQASQTDGSGKYTIINNNTFYNCDIQNAVSNTSGITQIEIEELV